MEDTIPLLTRYNIHRSTKSFDFPLEFFVGLKKKSENEK